MNRKGRFYFRTIDKLAKLIVNADIKNIQGLNLKYGDVLNMDFEIA